MVNQFEGEEQDEGTTGLIDLASTQKTSHTPHITDSLIEPYGKHSDDLVEVLEGQLYITDTTRPRPNIHRNWTHQPYFEADPEKDLFRANSLTIEDSMTHMYYDAIAPRRNNPGVSLRPNTPPEHVRPYNAHTIEDTIRPATDVPRHGVLPRPVSENEDNSLLDWSYDRIRLRAEAYINEIKNGRDKMEAERRPITGVLIGEPYVRAPHHKRTTATLLAPMMTLYGKQAD